MLRPLILALLLGAAATPAAAAILVYDAELSGPAESPPVASPGVGIATVEIDTDAHTLSVKVEFSGLLGPTSVSHIHCCTAVPGAGTAGVATPTPTFPGFPAGVTAGTYEATFDLTDLTSFNGAFVTANGGTATLAEAALLSGIADGKAYLNIHTTLFPAGEIRGFLTPASDVPEPGAIGLFGLGLIGLAYTQRRRRLSAKP